MNILIRFQCPDWIFNEHGPDADDSLLEELDPDEDGLEELDLADELTEEELEALGETSLSTHVSALEDRPGPSDRARPLAGAHASHEEDV